MRKAMLVLMSVLLASPVALADGYRAQKYAVTITNITSAQTFTPLLVVTHTSSIRLLELGEPASTELAIIAEAGDVGPMGDLLNSMPHQVFDTADSGGLLGPGESVTVHVHARGRYNRVSVVGMLIPTNDNFVALDSAFLSHWERSYPIPAHDAGSEFNDELCENIPGPVCGGEGLSDEDGEGYVHISGGIHGIGDLEESTYDWRNPVAQITVRRAH